MSDQRPMGRPAAESDDGAGSPLTRSQHLIWTGQELTPDLPLYNMGWRFVLHVDVDPELFARAFDLLVEQTDTFRMTFAAHDDAPRSYLSSDPAGQHKMQNIGGSEKQAALDALLLTPFDLSHETFRSALLHVDGRHWEWVLVQHHLATDAATGAILLERLSNLYLSLTTDPDYAPKTVPQFADWAAKETEHIKPGDVAFWSDRLQKMPAPEKPYVLERPGSSTCAKLLDLSLGAARMTKLLAMIETDRFAALTPHQALFNLLATAVFAWLARVTGSETVVVGVTTHGRTTQKARKTAGLFVEALPLAVEITPHMTLADLHGEVASRGMELMMHASPAASSAASHSKFNVILNFLKVAFGGFANAPVDVEWLDHRYAEETHALWINVLGFAGSDDLTLRLRLNEGVFPEDLPERASEQILLCLDAILDDPDMPVDQTALATGADQSMQLTKADPWTRASDPVDVCDGFEAHCLADPDATALVDEVRSFTRAELDKISNAIAFSLEQKGVGPGDRVGLYLTRGVHLIAAILGVFKRGAAYVPLDPLQPDGRLQAIVDTADLRLILTESRIVKTAPASWRTALVDAMSGKDPASVVRGVDPDADGYVLFTSGSTGTPKGVRVSRRSLARHAAFAAKAYSDTGPKVWALHSAIGFDLTVTSIVAPLVTGGVIHTYRERLDGTDLSVLDVFSQDAVDVVKLTPSHLSLVSREPMTLKKIRTLIVGGENLSTGLADDILKAAGSGLEIFNSYGPTEAVVNCMVHRYDPAQDRGASVPIGRPAGQTAVYLLDSAMNPVPDCVAGEVYIAGPDRLAKGYLNANAATRDRFVANPFASGQVMYRTGDIAHIDRSGVIHYHGRRDDQIKIGGVRIELGEIRSAVLSHGDVSDCALRKLETATDHAHLACYIVQHDGFDLAALLRALGRKLPRPMIPSSFYLVDRIPLTPNGKVDGAALSVMPNRPLSCNQPSAQAPANETEAELLNIWRTVLDREDFGTTDNFFDVGGDSVNAIRIASRAVDAGLSVTAQSILKRQTVSAVAAELVKPKAPMQASPPSRAALNQKSLARLEAVFGKKRNE